MGRGPAKAKAKGKLTVARKSPKSEDSARVRDLQKRLAESLEREKATGELLQEKTRASIEATEQQRATSETLRVISSSRPDVQPVFATILRSAVQVSGALMGGIYRFDGELIHLAGIYGTRPEAVQGHAEGFPRLPDRGLLASRAVLERNETHMPAALADPEFQWKEFAQAAGWRSSLSVPMLRDGQPIGAISVARGEPGPVSAR